MRRPGATSSNAALGRRLASLLEHAARVIGDAAVLDQPERFRRHRRQPRLVAGPQVTDEALREIDLDLVTLIHQLVDAGRRHDRQADIDAITREQAPEAWRNHRADAGLLHGGSGFLAARAAAKILPADDHISPLHLLGKLLVDADHQMSRHFPRRIGRAKPHLGIDEVGVDVTSKRPGAAFDMHGLYAQFVMKSAGETIRPAIAEAATVAEEAT